MTLPYVRATPEEIEEHYQGVLSTLHSQPYLREWTRQESETCINNRRHNVANGITRWDYLYEDSDDEAIPGDDET